jgi:hypothetical protein
VLRRPAYQDCRTERRGRFPLSRTKSEAASDHIEGVLQHGLPRFLGQSGQGPVQYQQG